MGLTSSKPLWGGIIFTGLLTIAFCHRKPSVPADVIARVGDRLVSMNDFKGYLERNAGTELAQMTPQVASALLDQYVEEILLSEYAAAHGVEIPADKIAGAVRSDPGSTVIQKRDEMRRNKLMTDIAVDTPPPTAAQVRDYYKQHQGDFRTEDEVHVRQILLRDESLADDISAKLKSGASFEQLSMDHSLAANAKKGGDIGYVSRGELPKIFEDEIFALKPGQISRVIQTDSMFHIFKVDDHRGPGIVDFATAEPVIQQRLKEEVLRVRLADLVARSKREIQAAVLTKRLPFSYSGALGRSTNE
jgi:peptidyl-prolyl cis-trans isomerase C